MTTATRVESHRTLPPAKMRALVSLYHQASNWVTPENLLERIDAVFVPTTQHHHLALPSQEGISLTDLQNTVQNLKTQPRMAQVEADQSFRRLGSRSAGLTAGLSLMLSKRERKMIEALYGINLSGRDVLPGWEVLQEMKDDLRKSNEEDRASERVEEEGGDFSDLFKKD